MNSELYNRFAKSTGHRASRESNALNLMANPELLPDVAGLAFRVSDKNHHKAMWALELVLEQDITVLRPYLTEFCEALPLFTHSCATRSAAKISMFVAHHLQDHNDFASAEQVAHITEFCFDLLIDDSKVAAKAYAMRALYEFGISQPWIWPALVEIIRKDFALQSAGYKSIGARILNAIATRRNKL